MKSTSHKSVFTGILDMNGNKIYNGSEVVVHENNTFHPTNKGKVVWKEGGYQIKGTWCKYDVYAWRKSIEVVTPKTKPLFIMEDMDSAWEDFSRTLGILEKSRAEIKRAFKYAYETAIENNLK